MIDPREALSRERERNGCWDRARRTDSVAAKNREDTSDAKKR